MYTKIKATSFIFISALIFSSCDKDNLITNVKEDARPKSYLFLNEKVNLPEDLSQEDLNYYLKNISLNSKPDFKNLRTGEPSMSKIDREQIPYEVLISLIQKALESYPDLSKEKFDLNDLGKIKKDFSGIANIEEAAEKKETLFEYYNFRVSKDLAKLVAEYLENRKSKNVRTPSNGSSYDPTPLENEVSLLHPIAAANVYFAKNDVEDMMVSLYGSHTGDGNSKNAFRHSAWNALMVKKNCVSTANKWKGLSYTQMFASAHEMRGPNNGLPTDQVDRNHGLMDLFNNLSGRTYMYNQIDLNWLGAPKNVPSEGEIKDYFSGIVSTFKSDEAQIKSYVASPAYTDTELGHYKDGIRDDNRTLGKLVHFLY